MKHVFYLDTCSSCRRILKEVNPGKEFELQNVKIEPISEGQLDFLAKMNGSYESLFNKQARRYRELELYNKDLKEEDYRELMLKEYTFLKRPIFVIDSSVFVCKNKANIGNLKDKIKAI